VQVKLWSKQELHAFWRKWYFPANATLYIVGDLAEPQGVQARLDSCASILFYIACD
jgi:predicted Zn-dependent peptidase